MVSIHNRCPWAVWGLAIDAGLRHRSTQQPLDRPDAGLSFAARVEDDQGIMGICAGMSW